MIQSDIAKKTVVENLAKWIYALEYNDIPERILEKTRYQTLSVLASIHAGYKTEAGQTVYKALTKWGTAGDVSVIPTGEKLSLVDAITINSAFSMALDYDDYLYMGHTGHSAVLASLAIAEAENLETKKLITAQVIANEIGGRVGASTVLGPQNGQAWSFIHAIEGAAIGAKLYELSESETAHALSIAMYQPTFTLWPGFMGPQSKVLTAAGPTITGIQAAQFAKQGMTGARQIFEHPRKGFWKFFTFVPVKHMLTGLGEAWLTDTLAYKKYPGCAYIDTSLDALFMVLENFEDKHGKGLQIEDIKSIQVEASLLTLEMDNLSSEHIGEFEKLSPVNINFSIPYNIAIGIIAGEHTGKQLEQSFLDANEADIRSIASKVELEHNWEMSVRVSKAFDRLLGKNSIFGRLSVLDMLKVGRGYSGELGGKKKNSLGFKKLLSMKTFKRVRKVFAKSGGKQNKSSSSKEILGDIGSVDFTRFEAAFPARVSIETNQGTLYSDRQNVPFGAPGQEQYFSTVVDKWTTEASDSLTVEQIKDHLDKIINFENNTVSEFISSACFFDKAKESVEV